MDFDQLDKIAINQLTVNCIVGLHPPEKIKPQPLTLSLTLYLDTRKAAHSTHLHDSVDYSAVARQAAFILEVGRFKLIETAAEAVAHNILASQYFENASRRIEAVRVTIKKPAALGGVGIPEIRILRNRDEISIQRLHLGAGERVVFRANHHLILRHLIPARSRITFKNRPY